MKDIPGIIRDARRRADITQQELGEKLGYTGESAQVSVRRWETGKAPIPLAKIRPLAKALNLTLDDLIP